MKNAGSDGSNRLTWLETLASANSATALKEKMRRGFSFLHDGLPKRVAVLGAGGEGRRLVKACEAAGIEVFGTFDNDATKRGTRIGATRTAPFDALATVDRRIPVIIASHRVLGSTAGLRAMGFDVAPFAALQVLHPEQFAPHMFYDGLVDDLVTHQRDIEWFSEALADDESRRVLDRVIGYRITMDPMLLADAVDWDLYGFSEILRLGSDEVYVDAGAFDGDSVRMFIEHVDGEYERVLAFEPDAGTFARLKANLGDIPKVELFNSGLHLRNASLGFSNDGSRGSILSAQADFHVKVVGLDEILDGSRVTFIKLNIEGAEPEALLGARASLVRWGPKLAISTYHRPSDIWALPKLIREMLPSHRFYLRQHDGGIIETVLYAHG